MAVIDMGNTASDRAAHPGGGFTRVDRINTADASGKITSIEIWCNADLTDVVQIATFYIVAGTNLTTRDSITLLGVTSGSKQTFTVDINSDPISMDVEKDDMIGIYYQSGEHEVDTGASTGWYWVAGDNIPCTNVTFAAEADRTMSLRGIGTTAVDNAIFFGTNF